jgi:hypothetical protein
VSKLTVNYTYFKEGLLTPVIPTENKKDITPNGVWILNAESSAQETSIKVPFFPCALMELIPEEICEYIQNNRESTRRIHFSPSCGGPP